VRVSVDAVPPDVLVIPAMVLTIVIALARFHDATRRE